MLHSCPGVAVVLHSCPGVAVVLHSCPSSTAAYLFNPDKARHYIHRCSRCSGR